MSLMHLNWSTVIAKITDIPYDVVFQIVEDGQLHEVQAHKVVLGMVSDTFKIMFYTTDVGDKTINEIKIEETTKPAFQIIIDHLYNIKSIQDSLEGKSVQEVFDVVNLIERYQMTELQEAVKELLANYPMADDTVMEVAEEAMHFTNIFQREAQLLLLTCANFLKPKLKDVDSMLKNESERKVLAALRNLMESILPIACPNCGYVNCKNGKEVRDGYFVDGIIVTNNGANDYWRSYDYGSGKVKTVDCEGVKIGPINDEDAEEFFNAMIDVKLSGHFLPQLPTLNRFFSDLTYKKSHNGVSTFLFKCQVSAKIPSTPAVTPISRLHNTTDRVQFDVSHRLDATVGDDLRSSRPRNRRDSSTSSSVHPRRENQNEDPVDERENQENEVVEMVQVTPPSKRKRFMFARCFEQTFDPRNIPGNDRILAPDSDED